MRKILLVLSLVIAILGIYSDAWLDSYLPSMENPADNRETINLAPYIAGKTQPISAGEIKDSDNAYIRLTLNFRVDDNEGYPNLFQTAPFNRGMRMEISESTATIIVPDLAVPDNGLRGLTLTKNLSQGRWYSLEVEALNRSYIHATLDGVVVANYSSPGLSMETSQLLVGAGFDTSRSFRGRITDISVTKGNVPKSTVADSQISNKAILIFSLVCFIIIVVIHRYVRWDYKFESTSRKSQGVIASLFIAQILLILIFPAYRNVVISFLFLSFIGINQYLLLTPSFLKERFSYFILIPLNGLLLLSVVGAYFIGFSIDINFLVPALLTVSLLAYLPGFIFFRQNFVSIFSELRADFSVALIAYTLILTPIILMLIAPVLTSDYTTSPYRIGPDLASYAKMSQYLLDGGTWAESLQRVGEFSGMSVGEINRYSDATMSWPLAYYFRWGLTAFNVAITGVTFSSHSFETAFISMVVPYLLMCGLVLIWIRKLMSLSLTVAMLGVAAIAFNSNMLNLWYEGFYGNVYALGFFVPILYIFSTLRSKNIYTTKDIIVSIAFSSMLIAASLLSYAEAVFFVLSVFIIFVFISDLLINKSIKWTPYLFILASACIGLLVILPCGFIVDWLVLAFSQITQEGGNGYPQPLWAFPHEILGIQNIYLYSSISSAGKMLNRMEPGMISGIIITGLTFYLFFIYFWNRRKEENVLFVASIIMVAFSVCYVYYKTPSNNYTYMKMYVFHLPLLFILFWASLNAFYEKYAVRFSMFNYRFPSILFFFLAIPIITNGIIYIAKYKEEATLIPKSKIDLHGEIQKINFDNVIMYPYSLNSNRVMFSAIFPAPWIIPDYWNADRWKDKPYYNNFMGHKVYLFIEKKLDHLYEVRPEKIVFQNQYYLIVDSGKIVMDGVNKADDSIDFDVYTHPIKQSIREGV